MANGNTDVSTQSDQDGPPTLEQCPKCGGTSGYRFNRYVKQTWTGQWEPEGVSKADAKPIPTMKAKNVICLDCGGYIPKKKAGVS